MEAGGQALGRTAIPPEGFTMIEYHRVPGDQVVELRHAILRPGLPRESAIFDGDGEPLTAHFAGIENGRVVACVTVMQRPYEDQPAWQLRGMAVAPGLRGMGVGARLLALAESHVRDAGASLLMWCNAREPAVGFYGRFGWQVASDRFEIPTAGPHFKMVRRL